MATPRHALSSRSYINRYTPSKFTSTIVAYLETIHALDATFFIDFAHGITTGRQGRLFFTLEFPNHDALLLVNTGEIHFAKPHKLEFPTDDETNQLLLDCKIEHLNHFYPVILSYDIVSQTQESAARIFSPIKEIFMPKFTELLTPEFCFKLEKLVAGALCYKIWLTQNNARQINYAHGTDRIDPDMLKTAETQNKTRGRIIASICSSGEDSKSTLDKLTKQYITAINLTFTASIADLQNILAKSKIDKAEKETTKNELLVKIEHKALTTITFYQHKITTLRENSDYLCIDKESKKHVHAHIEVVLAHLRSLVLGSGIENKWILKALDSIVMPGTAFSDQAILKVTNWSRKPSPPPNTQRKDGSKIMSKGSSVETSTPTRCTVMLSEAPSPPVRQYSGSSIFTRHNITSRNNSLLSGSNLKGYNRQVSSAKSNSDEELSDQSSKTKRSPSAAAKPQSPRR